MVFNESREAGKVGRKDLNFTPKGSLSKNAVQTLIDSSTPEVDQTIIEDSTSAVSGGAVFDAVATLEAADATLTTAVATKITADDTYFKQKVVAATTAHIALTGEQTIDTVAVVTGDRVLVKNRNSNSGNGIYIVSTGAWTRATDANSSTKLRNSVAYVTGGSQAGSVWYQSNPTATTASTATYVQLLPVDNTLPGAKIVNNDIANAKLATMPTNTLKAVTTSGTPTDMGFETFRTELGLPVAVTTVAKNVAGSALHDTFGLFKVKRPYLNIDTGGIYAGGILRFALRATDANFIGVHAYYALPLTNGLPTADTWFELQPVGNKLISDATKDVVVDVWFDSATQYYLIRARNAGTTQYYPNIIVKIEKGTDTYADVDTTYATTASGVTPPSKLYVAGHDHDDRYAALATTNTFAQLQTFTSGLTSGGIIYASQLSSATGDLLFTPAFGSYKITLIATNGVFFGSTTSPTAKILNDGTAEFKNIKRNRRTVSADTTFAADDFMVIFNHTSGTKVCTLPAANGAIQEVVIAMTGTGGAVSIVPAGSDTIHGAASESLSTQYNTAHYFSDGVSTWLSKNI